MFVEFKFRYTVRLAGGFMGSLLGPVLANIFVRFHEKGLLSGLEKPEVYFLCANDKFHLFNNEMKGDLFFTSLNNFHPAIKFTQEKEENNVSLLLVCRTTSCFLTSIYKKSTLYWFVCLLELFQPH